MIKADCVPCSSSTNLRCLIWHSPGGKRAVLCEWLSRMHDQHLILNHPILTTWTYCTHPNVDVALFEFTFGLIETNWWLPRQLYSVRLFNFFSQFRWFTDRSWINHWLLKHVLLPCFFCIQILSSLVSLVRPQLSNRFFNLIANLHVQALRITYEHFLQTLHKFRLLRFPNCIDDFYLDDQLGYLFEISY